MVIRLKIFQKTSYALVWLVFSFLYVSCRDDGGEAERKRMFREVLVVYKDTKPVAFNISRELLKNVPDDSLLLSLSIHLEGNSTRILGELTPEKDHLLFRPVLPFTEGLVYDIRVNGELITTKYISPADIPWQPGLRSVYPSADTLPENLLKFYIEFSDPMQAGHALEQLALVRNGKDTLSDVFLDLQPELWNKENTVLTVWLDPGRLKRDLQPNQKMGTPLQQGNWYQLVVRKGWRDAKGNPIAENFEKKFLVGTRDSLIPDYQSWRVVSPASRSRGHLVIDLFEPLDYLLLKNAIRVVDKDENIVVGEFTPGKNEITLLFYPDKDWKAGDYVLEIESRLEDLAGNNLNRLFDRDITKKENAESKEIYKKAFSIK